MVIWECVCGGESVGEEGEHYETVELGGEMSKSWGKTHSESDSAGA